MALFWAQIGLILRLWDSKIFLQSRGRTNCPLFGTDFALEDLSMH
jgi:hypothetical protein